MISIKYILECKVFVSQNQTLNQTEEFDCSIDAKDRAVELARKYRKENLKCKIIIRKIEIEEIVILNYEGN